RFCAELVSSGLDPSSICPVWGMSETSSGVVENSNYRALDPDVAIEHVVCVGRPIAGMAARIVDSDGCLVPCGTEGELQVRGAAVMSGYWGDPVQTQSAFTPDSWLRTGDLGRVQRGELYITGRQKETLILNGTNYHPQDIERLVLASEETSIR